MFRGVGVALVTLFRDDGDLDAVATADLAGRLVELGIQAIVVCGTTGEAAALEPDERDDLVNAVRKALPEAGGVPLIVGTGAPSRRQAARLTAAARDLGADAVLALSAPRATDPHPYYEAVAAAADGLPVLAYHNPAVSPPGIAVDALAALPVAGLKDSSADANRLLATLDAWEGAVYCGSSALISLAASVGCPGVILALANAEPEACLAAFAGDAESQLKLAKFRTAETRFPRGIKELVAARYGCTATTRLG